MQKHAFGCRESGARRHRAGDEGMIGQRQMWGNSRPAPGYSAIPKI
jgi:hypothetical protein